MWIEGFPKWWEHRVHLIIKATTKEQMIIYYILCENIGEGYFSAKWENEDT